MTNATVTIKAEQQKTRRALEAARAASDDARAACAFGTGSYDALVAAGRAEMAATRAWCDTWRPEANPRDLTVLKEDAIWETSQSAMHWEPLPDDGTERGRRLL